MSFNFIHDFQLKIYEQLSTEQEIRLKVEGIYLSVVQDAAYPFLLINILKIHNLSKFTAAIYNIEFEICAFARDKNQGMLASLADKITSKITAESCNFGNYLIAGIKAKEINFQRSQDLITTKMSIYYSTLIKQE